MIGKLGNSHLEPRLDSRHDLLIALGRDERDGKTLGPETASTSAKTFSKSNLLHTQRIHTRHGAGSCRLHWGNRS